MKPVDAPICLGGYVCPIYPSPCMDGATHILDTPIIGPVRVKPANEQAKKALDELEGKDVLTTACGYPRSTENCWHLEACYAEEAEASKPKLEALQN